MDESMSEPDFLFQCGEPLTAGERRKWFFDRRVEAMAKGASHHRFSVHKTLPDLILYEGWREAPCRRMEDGIVRLDEGEPRWQLSPVSS
jgi:hypothetical protein